MNNIISISKKSWMMLDLNSKICFFISIFLFILTSLLRISLPVTLAYIIKISNQEKNYLILMCFAYAMIFFTLRFMEEIRLALYVYFEQILQKMLVVNTLNKFFLMPFFAAKEHTASEKSIIIDRGLGGVRAALYNATFSLIPLIIETALLISIIWWKVGLQLAVEILLMISLFISFTFYFSAKTLTLQQKWFKTASVNYKLLSESIRAFEFIRSFKSSQWAKKRYSKATDKFIYEVKKSLIPGVTLGLIQGIILFSTFSISTITIVRDTIDNTEMVSLLVLTNGMLLQIALSLLQFSVSYRLFIQGLSSSKQLFDMLSKPTGSEKIPHVISTQILGFELNNVTVNYDNNKCIIYQNMFIPEKEITIISGISGVGKSTLAKVIAGLMEYNGIIKTKFTSDDIYYLHQNIDIFDTSFTENITLGKEFDKDTFDSVVSSAGFTPSEIVEISSRMLGEMGANISGGQAQRIGIARMLYHNAQVMIYDEPTTGLDENTVTKILMAIKIASMGRTSIIVTHDKRVKEISEVHINLE
jgi:ABC-type bacteriocin/lantibiotic exporter with double-glycine peptidase domain